MNYLQTLAILPAVGGVIVGVLAIGRGVGLKSAAPMSLELFTAAGLLKLAQDSSWPAIASAAAIILVRKLVMKSLAMRS